MRRGHITRTVGVAGEASEDPVDGGARDLLLVWGDRGELGAGEGRLLDVVPADDRDVLGYSDPEVGERLHGAERQQVVEAEDAVGACACFDDLLPDAIAVAPGPRLGRVPEVAGQAGRLHCLDEAGDAT